MGSKSKDQEGAEDRISRLPDDVRVHILSYLPTLCSVQTKVLSKGWNNNLWTFVPTLDLDYSGSYCSASWSSFAKFVDGALSSHKPPTIRKFRLHIQNNYYLQEKDFRRIGDWILAAMRHKLSEVDFYFSPFRYNSRKLELKLPTSVVRCKTLEVLKISSSCITYPTTGPGCFPSLKFADITATNGDNSSLSQLFCNCPELQTLRTSISASYVEKEPKEIIINAPKLQNLVVYRSSCTHYVLQNVNSLVKAEIENTYIHPYEDEDEDEGEYEDLSLGLLNRATAFLASVSRVEYLYLPGGPFETCSLPNFSNLKQLKLHLFGCSYLEYVMELVKRSPKLEDLVLDIDFRSWYDQEYVEGYVPFEPPEIVPSCVVSHLKTVSITQITGHDDQLDMVKYLLRHGEVLRNMTIVTCGIFLFKTRHITEERFQKEILMYPKISNTCDVEVKFENNGVTSDRCSDCGSDRLWCPGR